MTILPAKQNGLKKCSENRGLLHRKTVSDCTDGAVSDCTDRAVIDCTDRAVIDCTGRAVSDCTGRAVSVAQKKKGCEYCGNETDTNK